MEVNIFDIKSEFLHFVFAIKFSNLTIDLFNFVFEKNTEILFTTGKFLKPSSSL